MVVVVVVVELMKMLGVVLVEFEVLLVGCISGYTNYSGLINKLTSVGMIK